MKFSHLDEAGKANMVDVSAKPRVRRTARARGKIFLQTSTLEALKANSLKKGDALAAARIAGIMGAKETSRLIPLCLNIEIDAVNIEFIYEDDGIMITSTAVCTDKTGIEMEALTGVTIAALTIYDMAKAVDKTMRIGEITLIEKTKETGEQQ